MTSFFSAKRITLARTFLSISTALLHIFVTLLGVVARFNVLLSVIKDNSLENTHFSRISLDCFSPSSKAFRRSSSTSGNAITPDWIEQRSGTLSLIGSALKSSIQRIKSCTSFFILAGWHFTWFSWRQ